jgi:hypothetical protein
MEPNYRSKHYGIAPRAMTYLFSRLRERSQETLVPFYIRVSYCEIYNEQVRIRSIEFRTSSRVIVICH